MRDLLAAIGIVFSVHTPIWVATTIAFAASFMVVYFRVRRSEQQARRR